MTLLRLARRSATYYWRTNLAVLLGVAAAVSALGGALLVGESVRGSLREIALSRLGGTDVAISSTGFFRDAVSRDLRGRAIPAAAPLIIASGFVTHESSGRRAGGVTVYGVDERFWAFNAVSAPQGPVVSPALAAELGAAPGDVLLVRLQRPSEIPIESLFGRRDEIGRTVRLTLSGVLDRSRLGEFSLKQQQSELRAVFAPLDRIQRDLEVGAKVNTLLTAGADQDAVARAARVALSLEDLGLNVRPSADGATVIVDSSSGILSEPVEGSIRSAAVRLGYAPFAVFTYLANAIRIGDRQVPYSLVTATDLEHIARRTMHVARRTSHIARRTSHIARDGIVLNTWAARELSAGVGDEAEIEYYLWDANAGLTTHKQKLRVSDVIPIAGFAADRQLAPEYPGITSSNSLADWDPPFPIDLGRVRPVDERYWDDYRTTPKAFISYERGRDLWKTRYGAATSLRVPVPEGTAAGDVVARLTRELRASLSPASMGVAVMPVRRQALEASQGATDFGEYFTYFSFFLVVSALLLSVLFFRLGVEQRLRQIGVFRAAGFPIATVRRLLLIESMAIATLGSLLGVAGAVAYGRLIIHGLSTWWIGAVGTSLLTLHVSSGSLIAGALGGLLAALLSVLVSLRPVGRLSPRALLTVQSIGQEPVADARIARRNRILATAFAAIAIVALAAGFSGRLAQAGAFFGAGAAALIASLFFMASSLRSRSPRLIAGRGTGPVLRLGFRSAAFRPARSVLSAALIASAAFIIVSVDAFRKGAAEIGGDRAAGTGGFALIATSALPLLHNPNDAAGREALVVNDSAFERVKFTRFRVRPGDDASCLNLYRPTSPTIIAPEPGFIEEGRFTFAETLAAADAERRNPWLLLKKRSSHGPIPVIADATSLQYVLHASVGDTFSMDVGAAAPLELQFVASLADSALQGELIMSEENFLRSFPSQQGYRFFLIDADGVRTREEAAQISGALERELDAFGLDAVTAAERLESFHRVENTYLSTFQSLGALGLLLGTVGLAAVMFRNVLERRRELGLLRAVGYNRARVTQMILAEAALLVGAGLATGALSAALAVMPAFLGRQGARPGGTLLILLAAVAVAGVLSSAVAARAALGGEVLNALRAE